MTGDGVDMSDGICAGTAHNVVFVLAGGCSGVASDVCSPDMFFVVGDVQGSGAGWYGGVRASMSRGVCGGDAHLFVVGLVGVVGGVSKSEGVSAGTAQRSDSGWCR